MARLKNPNLKRAGDVCSYTQDQQLEIMKCMDSVEYFLDSYCQIQHAVKGAIPFKLFPYQRRVASAFQEHRLTITLAPRQIGKCLYSSTIVEALDVSSINTIKKFILWMVNRKRYDEIYKNV